MSILAVLGIVFVVLKVVGVIAWSWWLVLLPFFAIPVLVVGLLGLAVIGALAGGNR